MNNLKSRIMITVKPNSSIAKILAGKTKGYHQWYVAHVLRNSEIYKVEETKTQKDEKR